MCVYLAFGDSQFLDHSQRLGSKRLVQLKHIHILQCPARLLHLWLEHTLGNTFYKVCSVPPSPPPSRHTLTAFLTAGMGPVPIMAGSTPACAHDTTRARGADSPRRSAALREAITTAAAPSLIPEALPAVTEPQALSNAGLSLASPSAVVLGLGCSSSATTTGPGGGVSTT